MVKIMLKYTPSVPPPDSEAESTTQNKDSYSDLNGG